MECRHSETMNFDPQSESYHYFSHEQNPAQMTRSMSGGGMLGPSRGGGTTYEGYQYPTTTSFPFRIPTPSQRFPSSLDSHSNSHSDSQITGPIPPSHPNIKDTGTSNTNTNNTTHLATLQTQRTYLLTTLRHENERACTLLCSLSPLTTLTPPYDRRTRKRITYLSRRLDETKKQEVAILGRVNQLTAEIERFEFGDGVRMEGMLREGVGEGGGEDYFGMEGSGSTLICTPEWGWGMGWENEGVPCMDTGTRDNEDFQSTTSLDPKTPAFEPSGGGGDTETNIGFPFPATFPPSTGTDTDTFPTNENHPFEIHKPFSFSPKSKSCLKSKSKSWDEDDSDSDEDDGGPLSLLPPPPPPSTTITHTHTPNTSISTSTSHPISLGENIKNVEIGNGNENENENKDISTPRKLRPVLLHRSSSLDSADYGEAKMVGGGKRKNSLPDLHPGGV